MVSRCSSSISLPSSSVRLTKLPPNSSLTVSYTHLEPVLWDERRTTIEAHDILHTAGKKMKSHKKTVDAVAASLILEGYLTRKRTQG